MEGNVAFRAGQFSEAYRVYCQGLEVQRHDIRLHSNAAMASLRTKSYSQAIDHCDQVDFLLLRDEDECGSGLLR